MRSWLKGRVKIYARGRKDGRELARRMRKDGIKFRKRFRMWWRAWKLSGRARYG